MSKGIFPINNIAEAKAFEKVSPTLSKQYVPIWTSDVIEILSPEFTFKGGARMGKSTSCHYVDLESKDGTIRLYNSYNGQWALSANYVSGDVVINLNINRLIHRGEKAENFIDNLKEAKEDIINAVPAAKAVAKKLQFEDVTPKLQTLISDIIFEGKSKTPGFVRYNNYTDIVVEERSNSKTEGNVSVAGYIKSSIKNYFEGMYSIEGVKGKRLGRPHKNSMLRVHFQNKIIKMLQEEAPEYFL
jgi:hypothetical protein